MRITGGLLSGRAVAAPAGNQTRPTTDMVRESLFASLANEVDLSGARVLDAFCGSGVLAFEALSRGAAHALLLDIDASVCRTARSNAEQLGLSSHVTIMRMDVLRGMSHVQPQSYNLVFADPPYAERCCNAVLAMLERHDIVQATGIVVLEHDDTEVIIPRAGWHHVATRRHGSTVIDIVRRINSSS